MKSRFVIQICLFLVLIVLGNVACAVASSCLNLLESSESEIVMEELSQCIDSGDLGGNGLAKLYVKRGDLYKASKQYQEALKDYG